MFVRNILPMKTIVTTIVLFIAGYLNASAQFSDLIVKTTLDSIDCRVNSITGKGLSDGQIKFSVKGQKEGFQYSIDQMDVFYVKIDTTTKLNGTGSGITNAEIRPKYFNTNFDYTKSYFLKTGRAPKPDDPLQTKVAGYEKQDKQPQEWRYRAGKKLNTAGGLLLSSVALSVIGSLILTRADVGHNAGYVLLGAGGVSMIAGYGFLIGAGNTMQGR